MKYICDRCNNIIGEDELKPIKELMGECWGVPAYQTFYLCPYCKGDVEEYEEGTEED